MCYLELVNTLYHNLLLISRETEQINVAYLLNYVALWLFFRARSRSGGKGVLYRHFDNKKAPALLQGPTSIVAFVIRVFVRNVRNLDLLEFGIAFFGILSEVFSLFGSRCFTLRSSFIEFLIIRNQIIG